MTDFDIQILKIELICNNTYDRARKDVGLVSHYSMFHIIKSLNICLISLLWSQGHWNLTLITAFLAMPINFFFHSIIHLAKLLLMIDSLICSLMFLLFVTKLYFVISKFKGEEDILYTQCIKTIIAEREEVLWKRYRLELQVGA